MGRELYCQVVYLYVCFEATEKPKDNPTVSLRRNSEVLQRSNNQHPKPSNKQLLQECKTTVSPSKCQKPTRTVPDVHPGGISLLTALTEVRHPAVVSETTDCNDMGALATMGTLVDFVMFVERRARFATLRKMKKKTRLLKVKKLQVTLNNHILLTKWPTL